MNIREEAKKDAANHEPQVPVMRSARTFEERYAARTPFDRAIVKYSKAYADQNERDHAALKRAVQRGKVKAVFEEAR